MPHPLQTRAKRSPYLTPALSRMLRTMLDNDEELAWEGIECWVGTERFSTRTAYMAVRLCLIAHDGGIYWHVKAAEAKRLLSDPAYVPMIVRAMRTGKPIFQ